MKKILTFIVLYIFASISYAQTCPSVQQIFIRQADGRYDVVAPPGWLVSLNKHANAYDINYHFRIAAWGDHQHTSDSVRCYYYDASVKNDIRIETQDRIDESKIISHSGWDSISKLYHFCGSYDAHDVNQCQFN